MDDIQRIDYPSREDYLVQVENVKSTRYKICVFIVVNYNDNSSNDIAES